MGQRVWLVKGRQIWVNVSQSIQTVGRIRDKLGVWSEGSSGEELSFLMAVEVEWRVAERPMGKWWRWLKEMTCGWRAFPIDWELQQSHPNLGGNFDGSGCMRFNDRSKLLVDGELFRSDESFDHNASPDWERIRNDPSRIREGTSMEVVVRDPTVGEDSKGACSVVYHWEGEGHPIKSMSEWEKTYGFFSSLVTSNDTNHPRSRWKVQITQIWMEGLDRSQSRSFH